MPVAGQKATGSIVREKDRPFIGLAENALIDGLVIPGPTGRLIGAGDCQEKPDILFFFAQLQHFLRGQGVKA